MRYESNPPAALFCIWLATAWASAAFAQPAGPENPQDHADWVQQLGVDDFAQRELAVEALTNAGLAAKEALQAGVQSPDLHTQMLARQILTKVLELDFQRRIEAFTADKEGAKDHSMPGWDWYRETVGTTPKDRELFIRILKEEAPLLESVAGNPDRAHDAMEIRIQQLQQGMQNRNTALRKTPSMESIAGLLMVTASSESGLDSREQSHLYNLMYQTTFREAAKKGPYTEPLKRLLDAWILSNTNSAWTYRAVQISLEFGLPRGLDLALQLLNPQGNNSTNAYAIVAIGKLGGKDYVPALVPLLENDRVCWTWHRGNNKVIRTQIRDVALASLLHATEQDHKEYGFELLQKNPETVFHIYTVGFEEDEQRLAALERWNKWFAENRESFPDKIPERKEIKLAKPKVVPARPAVPEVDVPKADRVVSFAPADRLIWLNLDNALRLIQEERFVEAVTLLTRVLNVADNASYQPDFSVPLHRSIKAAAQRLIAQLPAAGREVYRLQAADAAQRALDEALESGDISALQAVLEQYFHTAAGYEAAYLLGIHYRDQGEAWTAAAYLSYLPESARPQFEPRSALSRADVWQRADVWDAAEIALNELRQQQNLRIAGHVVPELEADMSPLEWWSKWVSPTEQKLPFAAHDWLHYAGSSTRNRQVRSGIPLLEPEWSVSVSLPLEAKILAEIRQQYAEHDLAPVLTSHPLVIGDRMLVRTATRLVAANVKTGAVEWMVRLDAEVETMLTQAVDAKPDDPIREQLRESLEVRLFDDLTHGTFSSDGRLVFGIEGLSFDRGSNESTMTVQPNGTRFLDPGWSKTHNRLTAYDVNTGKLVWELGRIDKASDQEMFFLGTPLVMGSRLHVIGIVSGSVRLMELDGPTGRVVHVLELMEVEENQVLDSDRQRAGLSPSFADGVLICPISASETFALDLVSNEVLWAYRRNFTEVDPNQARLRAAQGGKAQLPAVSRRSMRQWLDGSAAIADGKVVFAPAGTDRIYCMALRSGALLWEQAALDGLFVGGIVQGKVLLVGNAQVRALLLESGEPAWPQAVPLRQGNAPSGRGYFTDSHYYLPLADGGVAKIEIATGVGLGTAHGETAGNLVAHQDAILSFTGDQLIRFPTTVQRRNELLDRAKETPDDAALHAELGAILLAEGKLLDAVEHLERAYELAPTAANRTALVEGMLAGIRQDFKTYSDWVEPLDGLAQNAAEREQFLVAVLQGSHASGDDPALLKAAVQLTQLESKPSLLEGSAALQTRRDRQVQSILHQRYQAEGAELFDEAIRAAASGALENGTVAALERFTDHFGFHESAHQVRAALIKQLDDENPLAVELRLLEQIESSQRDQAAEATYQLLQLMLQKKRFVAAAGIAETLKTQFGNVICDGERTGAEVVSKIPLAHREEIDRLNWPSGEFDVVSEKRPPRSLSYRMPLEMAGNARPFFYPQQVFVDQSARQIVGCDVWGRQQWQINLPTTTNVQTSFGKPRIKGRARGHLLLITRGQDVFALDTLGLQNGNARVLWKRTVEGTQSTSGTTAAGISAKSPETHAPLFAGNVVCFQQDYQLHAVDALSGESLWVRHDVVAASQVTGGRQCVLTTADANGQTRAFDPIAGRDLGQRAVPNPETHLANLEGKLLYREAGNLVLLDVDTQTMLWQQAFDPQARVQVYEDSVVGVLEPNGHLQVLNVLDGKRIVDQQLQIEIDNEAFELVPGRDTLMVMTGKIAPAEPGTRQTANRFGRQVAPLQGTLYGFAADTGKPSWAIEFKRQTLLDVQPFAAPIAAFGYQKLKEQPGKSNQHSWHVSVLCVDKRSGKLLCDEQQAGMLYGADVTAHPDTKICEISSQQHTWAFNPKE